MTAKGDLVMGEDVVEAAAHDPFCRYIDRSRAKSVQFQASRVRRLTLLALLTCAPDARPNPTPRRSITTVPFGTTIVVEPAKLSP